MEKQECILVGYVLSAASVATIRCKHIWGLCPLSQIPPYTETPTSQRLPDTDPLPDRESPLDRESLPDIYPHPRRNMGLGTETAQKEDEIRQSDRKWYHTETPHGEIGVKTLPCPKLRFWTVTSYLYLFVIAVSWICYNNPCLWVPNIDQSTVCTPIQAVEGEYYM